MNCCGQVISATLMNYPVLAQIAVTVSFEEHQIVIPNLRVIALGGAKVKVVVPTPLHEGADDPVEMSPDLARQVAFEAVKTYCVHIGFSGNITDLRYTGALEYSLPKRVISRVRELIRKEMRRGSRQSV